MNYKSEKQIILEIISVLKESPEISQRYKSEIESMNKRLAESEQNKYRVGVIGVTSSGKSTMINAVLGAELLCMDVRASSSQLVTCSKSSNSDKTARIYFSDDRPPKALKNQNCTPAQIAKYSSELVNSKNHESVKALELSVPNYGFPSELVLIDSPGLDAYNLEIHEKLTMENLLPMMDFCILVTTMKTNSDDKILSVLNTVAEYNVPLIIVQNMLDSVQPSIDGKKTKQMVAQEHKRRVERIVDCSKIPDKSTVRIVQISAVKALEQRISNKPDLRKLRESNYDKLIEQVTDVLEMTRPRIETNRLKSIKSELERLIIEGKNDCNKLSSAPAENFKFEDVDTKLIEQYSKIHNDIAAQLSILDINGESMEATRLKKLLNDPNIDESTLNEIKRIVNSCESAMLNSCKEFTSLIKKHCKMLNIDVRNIMSISSLGKIDGKLSIQTRLERKKVEKKGFGNKVIRFFGGLFDQDWGYEYIDEITVDVKSTWQNAQKYVRDARKACAIALKEWQESSEKKIKEIQCEIEVKRKAYNERINSIISSKKLSEVVKKMERILSEIVIATPDMRSSIKHTITDIYDEYTEMTLTAEQYSKFNEIHEKAIKINLELHSAAHDMIRKRFQATGRFMIVGWDAISMSSYIKRSFGLYIDDDIISQNKGKSVISQKITYCYCPSSNTDISKCTCLAILTNATQISQALKQINDSGIVIEHRHWKKIFLVLQDMTEVINGNAVKGAVEAMLTVPSELNLNCPSLMLINDQNIVYNLCAVQAQISRTTTNADIIEIIDTVRKSFPIFCTPSVEKTASEIIKSIFDRRNNNEK